MNERKHMRQRQESYLFILMGLILLGLMVSGYFLFVEKILPGISSSGTRPGATGTGGSDGAALPGTVGSASTAVAEQVPDDLQGDTQNINLYFGLKGKDGLVRETRKIMPEKNFLTLAGIMLQGLIAGPTVISEARTLIPAGTQIRSLFFYQGTFVVDLSREFVDNHPGGALEEMLSVYSIVNTLTELDKKARVRFLVNGNEAETLRGHVALKQLFSRNEAMIQ